jgi:hypothetical protein
VFDLCICFVLVSLTEIDAARTIAKRALKSISFRMEREKLNVWIAWLNLENLYGTNESLQKVLNEAVKFNEPLIVYLELAKIYTGTNKHDVSIHNHHITLSITLLHMMNNFI